MTKYDDALAPYEEEAEDRYDDYDQGYDDDYEDEEFYEDEEDYEDVYGEDGYDDYVPAYDEEFEDVYDDYTASSAGRIDPNDRTITVVVKNESDSDQEAIIFGGNEEADQPTGVTVSVEESSHKEVREESKSSPFLIRGLKLSVSDELQLDNVLKITSKTATGSRTDSVYQPRNATSPQNFSNKMIDDSAFEMTVTGTDSIRFRILSKATAIFTFTIKARTRMGNLLKGSHVTELSRSPRPTGLPQIDLLRKRRVRRSTSTPAKRRIVGQARPRPRRKISYSQSRLKSYGRRPPLRKHLRR